MVSFVTLTIVVAYGAYTFVRNFPNMPLLAPVVDCVVGTIPENRVTVDTTQMANAATISAVAIRRKLPRQAIVIALATAWQESKLENRTSGDRDSVGLFQQRPSQGWGTPEQIYDPRYAAGAFYTALMRVPGWQNKRVTDAAQAVQRSAYPEAYEQWATRAETLTRALLGEDTGAIGCTIANEPSQRGEPAVRMLAEGLRLDWGDVPSTTQTAAVSLAVRDPKIGWQYAHWLVAHADARGIRRVRYGGQEWSAKSGDWSSSTGDSADDGNVVAEVRR